MMRSACGVPSAGSSNGTGKGALLTRLSDENGGVPGTGCTSGRARVHRRLGGAGRAPGASLPKRGRLVSQLVEARGRASPRGPAVPLYVPRKSEARADIAQRVVLEQRTERGLRVGQDVSDR